MTDLTPAPEGQPSAPPEAPATPDFGASPEVIQQALNLYNGINNLDTRHQYLQQVVRPDIDGQFLRQFGQQEEQPDPYEQFYAQQEPEYEPQYEPQAPVFDPREFGQSIEQRAVEQATQTVMAQLHEMALAQQVTESASAAVQQSGLPPALAGLVEQQVREQQRLQPNRQASDLAQEAARNLQAQLSTWQATPPANPAPNGQVPTGPAPDTLQKPRTIAEAMEYSRQVLNP